MTLSHAVKAEFTTFKPWYRSSKPGLLTHRLHFPFRCHQVKILVCLGPNLKRKHTKKKAKVFGFQIFSVLRGKENGEGSYGEAAGQICLPRHAWLWPWCPPGTTKISWNRFRHKSSSPSHWKKHSVFPICLLNFGQISCPRSLKIPSCGISYIVSWTVSQSISFVLFDFFRNPSNYEELYKTLQRLEVNMSSELPSFLEAVQHKEPGEFVQTVWAALSPE